MPVDTPERILRPRRGLVGVDFAELWRFRELFGFLAWRDIVVRYKQTYLGVAWAVLQPVLTTLIFSLIFGGLARFDSKGAPYVVMTFAALLPWQFFANALTESSNSLVASARIISKVYFPRLIVPCSAVLSGIVDVLVSLVLLVGLMIWKGVAFRPHLLLLPIVLALCFVTALAAGVWLSALNVRYRDVKYIVPFFTRVGLYATPVGFASTLILDRFGQGWFALYYLNPMTGLVDAFRWCVLGDQFMPWWPGFAASLVLVVIMLATGLIYFRSTERSFADIV